MRVQLTFDHIGRSVFESTSVCVCLCVCVCVCVCVCGWVGGWVGGGGDDSACIFMSLCVVYVYIILVIKFFKLSLTIFG